MPDFIRWMKHMKETGHRIPQDLPHFIDLNEKQAKVY